MFEIIKAGTESAVTLRQLAIQTFEETYAKHNSKEDMENYISKAFAIGTILQEMQDKDTDFFICFLNGIPVGYSVLNYGRTCEAIPDASITELQRIYVLKSFHNMKAGKALLLHAISSAASKGYKWLWLGVWKENERAHNFYFSQGFDIISERNFLLGSRVCEDYYMAKIIRTKNDE